MRRIFQDVVGLDKHFQYRGKQQTRDETFSDAVFALALTLLVLSSTIPSTFEELWASLNEIIPFAICITLITLIWYQHYIFFLKYGLQDKASIFLNTILLFLLLVYVYPLKFLTRYLTEIYGNLLGLSNTDLAAFGENTHQNFKGLMITYGTGAFAIFLILALLYSHALKKRKELHLNKYEVYSTKTHVWANLIQCSIPMISTICVLIDFWGNYITVMVGGFLYFLHIPAMIIFGAITKRQSIRILRRE